MFSKLLIANRGEIAVRIIRTARRMGIETVAVYSDADANSLHVALADEAVCIGPPPAAESYLRIEPIIEAAVSSGADAIHPGYGFLSENPDFVTAVENAGITFVGPSADAIRAMGLKDNAKKLMEDAGVPVVPGYHGSNQDADHLAAQAELVGYPVLIKARAGGGGKGMRLVDAPGAFSSALEGAMREAQASFGDPACLIEKYITQPRHIEIQIMGDAHGNVVHLFERDCSLQRRHQKVIEEAPAPNMPPEVRAAMGKAAVNAAQAINYQGAGTVEFIVDGSGGLKADGFWFMEMNTRLQVEHPVTEAITGLDLVELQLRVASGEPLPFSQDDLTIDGHSFEARIYAEDVSAGFLPATGTLDHLSFSDDARIDTGIRQGDTITPFYDPMIAKVTVHGRDRTSALSKLRKALEATHIVGSTTNVAFLHALASHNGFASGNMDTGLIDRDLSNLTAPPETSSEVILAAAITMLGISDKPFSGFRQWSDARIYFDLQHGGHIISDCLIQRGPRAYQFGAKVYQVSIDGTAMSLSTSDGIEKLTAIKSGEVVTVFHAGHAYSFGPMLIGTDDDQSKSDTVIAPMPGLVKLVEVKAGDKVSHEAPLMVLEAMKMEHTLKAPRDGKVVEVLAVSGDQVEADAVLIKLEPIDD